MNRTVAVSTALLMFLASLALAPLAPVAGQVSSTLEPTTLTFFAAGEDSSMVEQAVIGSTVLSATLQVDGLEINPGGQPDDYTPAPGGPHAAWYGIFAGGDPAAPANLQATPFETLADLPSVDGVTFESNHGDSTGAYHHFRFSVDDGEIVGVSLSWDGNATTGASSGAVDLTLFVYDMQMLSWEELDSVVGSPNDALVHLEGTITDGAEDFVDADTGIGHGLVTAKDNAIDDCDGGNGKPCQIDDVEIAAVEDDGADNAKPIEIPIDPIDPIDPDPGNGSSGDGPFMLGSDGTTFSLDRGPAGYPSALHLDVGDDGTFDWSFAGALSSPQTIDITEALQGAVDDASGVPALTTPVILVWSTGTPGRLHIDEIAIEYRDEKAPIFNPFPSTLTVDEDSGTTDLLDLATYLSDPDTAFTALTISVNGLTPTEGLEVAIVGGHLKVTTQDNWHGIASFFITAQDGIYTVDSPTLSVSVESINDAPVFATIPAQTVSQDATLQVQLSASDVDSDLDEDETLTFSTTVAGATIDAQGGLFSWTPSALAVGTHHLGVSVTDASDESTDGTIDVTVTNVNDAPTGEPLGTWQAQEDRTFSETIVVSDLDAQMDPNEVLSYADDTDLFDVHSDGTVRFTPTQSDVGSHDVTITVSDTAGAELELPVTVEVANTNDAPTIEGPTTVSGIVGTKVELTLQVHDDDLGFDPSETLSATTDFGAVDAVLNPDGSLLLSWTPQPGDEGTLSVRVLVRDHVGMSAAADIGIEIGEANAAPEVALKPADASTSITEGTPWVATVITSDPNGNDLEVVWIVDGVETPNHGRQVSLTLPPGTHTITVRVSDGELTTEQTTTVTVVPTPGKKGDGKDSKGAMPGFESVLVLAGLLAALGIARRRRQDA